MDFPREASHGVFRPEQFEAVRQVFDSITSEDWLLDAYRNGLTDPFELRTLGRAAARERFAVH